MRRPVEPDDFPNAVVFCRYAGVILHDREHLEDLAGYATGMNWLALGWEIGSKGSLQSCDAVAVVDDKEDDNDEDDREGNRDGWRALGARACCRWKRRHALE